MAVIQPSTAVALALEGALHFPAAYAMLVDKSDNVDLLDVQLRNRALSNKTLKQIRLPGNALVLGIRRKGETLVPRGNTFVRMNDILVLIGNTNSLQEARSILGGVSQETVPLIE